MKGLGTWLFALLVGMGTSACGSDEDAAPQLLDPASDHYGKSYAGWAASWVEYVNRVAPPDCVSPLMDATGASCALYQDPESPVFFLVGNFGGVSKRTKCVVPSGKALFFPLLNVWGDNAGVPADMTLSDADIKTFAESTFETLAPSLLHLTVDGRAVEKLESGALPSAPYVLNLKAGENPFACMGLDDVEGEFPGYTGGYFAMLAPLSDGPHTVRFGGGQMSASPTNDVSIDVSYELNFR
ncbi:MAG TPA: hypothetical protein VG937_37420 [Polyangiaceae bacterium]|nr:hypothetical protein [Polyangiaceae bacterium]